MKDLIIRLKTTRFKTSIIMWYSTNLTPLFLKNNNNKNSDWVKLIGKNMIKTKFLHLQSGLKKYVIC